MAAEIVGNALPSAFIQGVIDKLDSPQVLDLFGGKKLDETLLSKLKVMLLSIDDALVDDAERKQVTDDRVRQWLFEVKLSVVDAQDILDETHCDDALKCKLEAEAESQTRTCTVPDSFNDTFSLFNKEIESRMKQVLDKLEYLANQKGVLGLKGDTYHQVQLGSRLKEATNFFNLGEVTDFTNQFKYLRSLNLSNTGIKQLPDSLCSFDNLQILNLGYNDLEELPPDFQKLVNLERLQLGGTKLSKVPDSIGDLRHLRSLDLSNSSIKKLPDSVCSLYNLQILKLRYCNHLEELPQKFYRLVNLRVLELVGTKIRKVPDSIGNLIHLCSLDLSETDIKELPDSTCLLYNLQMLKLNFCINLEELPSNLHKLVNLQCLEVVGTKLRKVPDSIGDLIHLNSLDLSNSCIKQLPDLLCSLNNLQILKLRYCNDLEELAPNLHKLVNLERLEFGGTKLSKVPDSIADLIHLHSLDLSNSCIKKLPDSVCSLYNLQILKLRYCNNLEELPPNFHKLVNLRGLEFVGTKLRKVPDSIGNLIHLCSLDLSETDIKELPDSTCLLYNLQILKLNFCINLEELPSNLHKLVNLRCLEFVGTKLRKALVQLGELKNLQVMGSFYVGKSSESSIQQLGKLNLHGEVLIEKLQNIVNPSNALAVDLKNKRQLVELKLEWSRNWTQNKIPDDPLKEKEVSENLQPSEHLRKLSIINYGGTQFPHWLLDNSLSNVVFLRLDNCKYCSCLPPLGLLPSLNHLTITGLDGIVGIYAYFYGSHSFPFTSLRTLEFADMKEWKEWESEDMTCVFPRLQHLSIKQCPKLKGYLPKQIPLLRKLIIRDCKQLVASGPTTLEICDLELQDCGKLQFDYHLPTLKRLTIRGHNMEASMLKTIEHVICHTSLEFLLIDSCPNMNIPMSLCYKMLEKLKISGACDSLTIFPLDLFPRLSQLELRSPNLRMISQSHTHNNLKDLKISGCPQFQSLPEQMHALLPSLENLHIKDCPKVESFPDGGLPSNLTRMDLSNCYNLISSLKEAIGASTCLRTLSIGELHVKSFPDEGLLPISLKVLQIHSCFWLEKLDYKGLCQLSSLEELILDDCTRLQCLPEEGLPRSISTLRISRYCSLLKQRCLEPEGQYWGKITHIKNIWVDGKPI